MDTLKQAVQDVTRQEAFGRGQQLVMLVLNYIPLIHALSILGVVLSPWGRIWMRVLAGIVVLYLLPPLLVRLIRCCFSPREGRFELNSREFLVWWALLCLQVTFCRFPPLEELLRMIPGLYSQWLRLWGASIGRLTYWAAGTVILDRSFIEFGDDVILGAGVKINPHVIQRRPDGKLELALGTVKIGHKAVIGGYSLLTAGTEIAPGETTPAFLVSPPFSRWKDGKRMRSKTEDQDNPIHIWPTK
jgi:hypothetical protein